MVMMMVEAGSQFQFVASIGWVHDPKPNLSPNNLVSLDPVTCEASVSSHAWDRITSGHTPTGRF